MRAAVAFVVGVAVCAGPAVALGRKPAGKSKAAGRSAATTALPGAVASPDRARIPPPGPPPRIALPSPKRYTFASGARLLVMERHTLPMVVVAVVWPHGAAWDPAGREGLASLTAALLDQGTATRGALALAAELQGLGTSLGAGAGWDSTAVSMVTLRKNLDASMALLADVALRPAFAPAEFQRVRTEHVAAVQQRKDSAQDVAGERLVETIYGAAQRMGLPASGTEASLGRLTRDEVLAFHKQLRMDECLVVAAGDVDAETMRALTERHFGPAALRPTGAPGKLPAAGTPPPPRRLLVDRPGAPQSEVRLGLPGPPRLTPDYFALVVMNEILGGGDFSNRLNLNLREAHAYAYGAGSSFAFRATGGPFVAATATKTAVTGPAVREALGELARMRTEAVKPEELRFAKDSLQRSMARRFETLQDLVFEVAAREVLGLPEDFFATFAGQVEAVTDAEVLRVARRWLDPARLSIVIVGDRAAFSPQLEGPLPGLPAGVFEGLPAAPSGSAASPNRASAPAPPPIPSR